MNYSMTLRRDDRPDLRIVYEFREGHNGFFNPINGDGEFPCGDEIDIIAVFEPDPEEKIGLRAWRKCDARKCVAVEHLINRNDTLREDLIEHVQAQDEAAWERAEESRLDAARGW